MGREKIHGKRMVVIFHKICSTCKITKHSQCDFEIIKLEKRSFET